MAKDHSSYLRVVRPVWICWVCFVGLKASIYFMLCLLWNPPAPNPWILRRDRCSVIFSSHQTGKEWCLHWNPYWNSSKSITHQTVTMSLPFPWIALPSSNRLGIHKPSSPESFSSFLLATVSFCYVINTHNFILNNFMLLILEACMNACLHMCIWNIYVPDICGDQKVALNTLELKTTDSCKLSYWCWQHKRGHH